MVPPAPPKDSVKTTSESSKAEQLIKDYGFDYGGTQMLNLPGGIGDPSPMDAETDNNNLMVDTETSSASKPKVVHSTRAVRTYSSEEVDWLLYPEKALNREQRFRSFISNRKLIEPEMIARKSFGLNQIPRYNDESYRLKLEILHSEIPLTYNESVKAFIENVHHPQT